MALVVCDARAGVSAQDQRIAQLAMRCGCATALVLNKWDLVVPAGAHIPSIPEHVAKAAVTVVISEARPARVLTPPYTVEPPQDGERYVELRRNGDIDEVKGGIVDDVLNGTGEARLRNLPDDVSACRGIRIEDALDMKAEPSIDRHVSELHDLAAAD